MKFKKMQKELLNALEKSNACGVWKREVERSNSINDMIINLTRAHRLIVADIEQENEDLSDQVTDLERALDKREEEEMFRVNPDSMKQLMKENYIFNLNPEFLPDREKIINQLKAIN